MSRKSAQPESFVPSASRLAVWNTLGALNAAADLDTVRSELHRYCAAYGFHNFGFALRRNTTGSDRFVSLLEFPSAWAARYEALAAVDVHSSDPVIQHVTKAIVPTTWDCKGHVTFTEPTIAKSARSLLGAAGEHTLRAGMTIPLFSPDTAWSFLVLTSKDGAHADDLLPELPWACLVAQSVMMAVRKLTAKSIATITLTQRESEIIRWCAAGKTSWEIGQIMTISPATVNFHLGNAAKKLGTTGRRATCLRAIAAGLVQL